MIKHNPNAMKPYNLIFGRDELLSDHPIHDWPEWTYYPISFSDEMHYYKLTEMEILSQRVYHTLLFYIDLV